MLSGGGGKGAAGDAVVLARGAALVGQVGRAGGGAGAVAALDGVGRLVRDRAPVEITAPGPPTPRHIYGAHAPRPVHPRYSTHYVLHFESGHYMIAGGGNQPSTHSVPYLPFRYQMLPWFLSAVERGRDGAQLAGMFERDACLLYTSPSPRDS